MIKESPNLESLELDLEDVTISRLKWSPEHLCSNLEDMTFAGLRTLRILGTAEPEWRSFFEEQDTNSYYAFLRRHRKLHTVSIAWAREHSWQIKNPEQLVQLFPSLRHFEGPAFICQALARSSLAAELESLSLLDRIPQNDEIADFANNLVEMPCLLSLSFVIESEELKGEDLSKILSLSPSLKKLSVWSVASDLEELIGVLNHAPNLEELTIYVDMILRAAGKSTVSEWVHELALQLPKLRIVHDCSQPELRRHWQIHRVGEHDVQVMHMQPVRQGPPGDPFPMLSEAL